MPAAAVALVACEIAYARGVYETASGRRYRFTQKKGHTQLEIEHEGAWTRAWPPVDADTTRAHAPSPDGRRLLLGVGKKLVEADLDAHTAATRAELVVPVRGVAWLDDARALMLDAALVHVVDLSCGPDARLARSQHYAATHVFAALRGQLVVLVRSERYAHRTVLFAQAGDCFYRFAELEPAVERVFEREGCVYATRGDQCFLVQNAEAALEAALALPRAGEAALDELAYVDDDERIPRGDDDGDDAAS